MVVFELQAFLSAPSLERLDECRKDNLLEIAAHFEMSLSRQLLKREIKKLVVEKLVELHVLSLTVDPGAVISLSTPIDTEKREADLHLPKIKAILPRFEVFSPQTSGSLDNAHMKECIHLELDREERAEQRQAEHELKLTIRRMELEVDREVQLRELDTRVKEFTL
ncbi:uncharacterized protein LOC107724040 [Tachysurus ichikawai]